MRASVLWFVTAILVTLTIWLLFSRDTPFVRMLVIGVLLGMFVATLWRFRWRG